MPIAYILWIFFTKFCLCVHSIALFHVESIRNAYMIGFLHSQPCFLGGSNIHGSTLIANADQDVWRHVAMTSLVIMVWISNYIHVKLWAAITHPRQNFSCVAYKPLLNLGHGRVITAHINNGCDYLCVHDLSYTTLIKWATSRNLE